MSNEFWAEFETLLDRSEPEAIEYRVHYNENGDIYLCTMQNHPVDTTYVVATKEEYEQYYNFKVVKGLLVRVVHDSKYRVQLRKSTAGYKTVKDHASVLLEDEDYPNVEYYEYRNN